MDIFGATHARTPHPLHLEQESSMQKPEVKPTIRGINRHLVRFERDGHYTPLECMKQRGDWIKMMAQKPKRRR
jgi:hypothetical protein